MEASAKARHNVQEIFMTLSKDILDYRKAVNNISGSNTNTTAEPVDVNINLQEKRDNPNRKDKARANNKNCC